MAAIAMSKTTSTTKPTRAKLFEQAWIWSVVGYSVLRVVVAWGAFAEHGANIWIFALIDIGTAWPYGKSVAVVCRRSAHAEWRRLPGPVAVALATFFAPYAYLWFAAGTMPAGVRFAMALAVTVLFLAATLGVVAKSRRSRRDIIDRGTPAGEVADEELVIDLRTATSEHARAS